MRCERQGHGWGQPLRCHLYYRGLFLVDGLLDPFTRERVTSLVTTGRRLTHPARAALGK